jgi:Cu+-exporting ATPase
LPAQACHIDLPGPEILIDGTALPPPEARHSGYEHQVRCRLPAETRGARRHLRTRPDRHRRFRLVPGKSGQGGKGAMTVAGPVSADSRAHGESGGGQPSPAGNATDPVCGMTVDPATARHRAEYCGREYLFCGARCHERFTAEPERFLGAAPPPQPTPAAAGAPWTCPMHPEIVRDGPGACPICGMALEPMTPTAGEGSNPELSDMTRRFWVGVALSAPLLAMAMGEHIISGWHSALTSRTAIWLQLALATPVVLWSGAPFFKRGGATLVNRRRNKLTHIALGTRLA